MSHLITISYTDELDKLYVLAINEANAHGGKVIGNKFKGSFSIPAFGGKFEGVYEVKNNIIQLTLLKKPFFVPNALVERFLKENVK